MPNVVQVIRIFFSETIFINNISTLFGILEISAFNFFPARTVFTVQNGFFQNFTKTLGE